MNSNTEIDKEIIRQQGLSFATSKRSSWLHPIVKTEVNLVYYMYNSKTSCLLISRILKVFWNYIFVLARKKDFNNI